MSTIREYLTSRYANETIADIAISGCASGACPDLIYYEDTTAFYIVYKDEIWDRIVDFNQQTGLPLSTVIDMDQITSHEQLVCSLVWFAVESAAHEWMEEVTES